MLNVYMAIFWFVLGAVLIVVHATTPEAPMRTIGATDISPGWFCLALGLFNTLRFWTNRYVACVLFVVGVGLVVYHFAVPSAPMASIGATGISPGWFLVLLSGYVTLRWLTSRRESTSGTIQDRAASPPDRRKFGTLDAREPEYNPELDFRDRPNPRSAADSDTDRTLPVNDQTIHNDRDGQ